MQQQLVNIYGHIAELFYTHEHIVDDIVYMGSKPTVKNRRGKFTFDLGITPYYMIYSKYILDLKDIHNCAT